MHTAQTYMDVYHRIIVDYRIVPAVANARVIIEALHDGANWTQAIRDV